MVVTKLGLSIEICHLGLNDEQLMQEIANSVFEMSSAIRGGSKGYKLSFRGDKKRLEATYKVDEQCAFSSDMVVETKGATMPPEWKPFSTAPRDGQQFLSYHPSEGTWVTQLGTFRDADGDFTEGYVYVDGEAIPSDKLPTHWMPLSALNTLVPPK